MISSRIALTTLLLLCQWSCSEPIARVEKTAPLVQSARTNENPKAQNNQDQDHADASQPTDSHMNEPELVTGETKSEPKDGTAPSPAPSPNDKSPSLPSLKYEDVRLKIFEQSCTGCHSSTGTDKENL